MTKKEFNTESNEMNTEVENVDTNVVEKGVESIEGVEADIDGDSEEVKKAKVLLRARMDKLSENGLSFEKRNGSFFRGTIEKDEKGEEKLRRKVVNIDNQDEDDFLSLDEETMQEVNVKRAAAFVEQSNVNRAKIDADIEIKKAEILELEKAKATFDGDLAVAIDIVMSAPMPEKASRTTMTVKVNKLSDENEKLRQMLIAAGINPDEN